MNSATRLTLVAIAAIAIVALLVPASASGGAYRVAVCNPALGARHADAVFQRTSPHYVSGGSCRPGHAGLTVGHDGERTKAGRWGEWTVRAPRGTIISRLGVSAAGRSAGGHVPQLLTAPLHGPMRAFATPDPGTARSRLATPSLSFAARLACHRASGCARGRKARIRIAWLALRLTDRVAPTLTLGGSAFGHGPQRGLRTVEPSGTDIGGGVHHFLLQVNGEPLSGRVTRCRAAEGFALRLRPCPAAARTRFGIQTAEPPFHQGLNRLRVCSVDYARGTEANRRCATRRMRVDNLCPISSAGPGPSLEAHISRARHSGRDVAIRGRLRSASGAPVAAARVCVTTRVQMAGAGERVVATPVTGADGSFAANLPQGPNRRLRVAYWWSGHEVAERHLDLRVRARPRLKLHPRHPLHNGHHVRFKVRLPGPSAAHSWVRIQARSGKRWIELRSGRANARGVYRARYRFHATTGRQRYAFRAVVPSQRGYPYRPGHSRVRHVTVVG